MGGLCVMLLKQHIVFVQRALLWGSMNVFWDTGVAFCSFLILSHSSFSEVESLGVFHLTKTENLHGKKSTPKEKPPLWPLHSGRACFHSKQTQSKSTLLLALLDAPMGVFRNSVFWRNPRCVQLTQTMKSDRWDLLNSDGEKLQERWYWGKSSQWY